MMPSLVWDASALIKRYTPEKGTGTVDALFRLLPNVQFLTTLLNYGETYSILCRKLNDNRLNEAAFNMATLALEYEILRNSDVGVLTLDESVILLGINLIKPHTLNATDAVLLAAVLNFRRLHHSPEMVWLVTSDQRLVRAAAAEGVHAINLEEANEADLYLIFSKP